MVVMETFPDLAGRLRDGIDDLSIDESHLQIRQRGGLLHCGEGGNESRELAQLDSGDAEVLHRAQSLDAVESACGYIALAQQVVFPTRRSRQVDARSLRRFETQPSETGRA